MAADYAIMVGTFVLALHWRHYDSYLNIISRRHIVPEALFAMAYCALMIGVFSAYGLYQRRVWLTRGAHGFALLKAAGTVLLIYLLARTSVKSEVFLASRLTIAKWAVFLTVGLAAHRLWVFQWLLRFAITLPGLRRRIAIIGDSPLAAAFLAQQAREPHPTSRIIGIVSDHETLRHVTGVPHLGTLGELKDLVARHSLEGAIIIEPDLEDQELMDLVEECIGLFGWADIHSVHTASLHGRGDLYFNIPFVRLAGVPQNLLYYAWKRIFDTAAAALALLLLSPLLGLIALLVKLSSPGPVFYTSVRIGRFGQPFLFYKFRSMRLGADQDPERTAAILEHIQTGTQISTKVINPAYVTPVGRFIRKWAIDELPQLWNVVRGDMALVGPRPVPPSEYEACAPWQQRRFDIRPGCAGLWKLQAARAGITFKDTALYDLFYARNMSALLDLYILIAVVFVILRGKADK
ncbi:MAG: exopolysaccharide biosynthesis polyprenyl glycosylphosphotransferase [Candidatus Marinimicrobia bacterium]|nr:exopolysaccharide biosynthesis polyprenyl glycosylphosphotransferase [Candidatus Neomarinimicrobiota bacterium]